ncbi:MAG: helix-turn-helix transcriptional regulator [Planctomycetota bacterium]
MATAEVSPGVQPTRRDNDTVALAITVLMDRIMQLTAADRADLLALVSELHTAVAEEDRLVIGRAIREVIGGTPGTVQRMDLGADKKKPQGYKIWVEVVSKRVSDSRKKAKLTQDQLAAKTGLPQSHISRIEGAKLSPSNTTLAKIAVALNLPIDHFDFS